MPVSERLHKIREAQFASLTVRQKIFQVLWSLAMGMLLGFIAKYSDTIPANGWTGSVWGLVRDVTSDLGIWVFAASLLAGWSSNPRMGAGKVFFFFVGMLVVYYIYSAWLFGFFPAYYFFRWGVIALASPLAAYMVWYGRGNGWLAACCAAMPIAFLVAEGSSFVYTFAPVQGLALLYAAILFFVLPIDKKQWLRILPAALLIVLILKKFDVLSYLFGGL